MLPWILNVVTEMLSNEMLKVVTEILSGSLHQWPDSKFRSFSLWTPNLQIRLLISLECTGPQQHNSISPVCIRCMDLTVVSFSVVMQIQWTELLFPGYNQLSVWFISSCTSVRLPWSLTLFTVTHALCCSFYNSFLAVPVILRSFFAI